MSAHLDQEHIERLRKSSEFGFLQPVLVDAKDPAKVYVGRHRMLANKNWSVLPINVEEIAQKMNLPKELAAEIIIFQGNCQRTIKREETRDRLLRIAKILESQGIPKQRICASIAKLPGMPSDRWIREVMEELDEYKMDTGPEKSEVLPISTGSKTIDEMKTATTKKVQETRTSLDSIDEQDPLARLPFEDCKCKQCSHLSNCPR
jgi:hypothetical protein